MSTKSIRSGSRAVVDCTKVTDISTMLTRSINRDSGTVILCRKVADITTGSLGLQLVAGERWWNVPEHPYRDRLG
jgi:hypothetical protein